MSTWKRVLKRRSAHRAEYACVVRRTAQVVVNIVESMSSADRSKLRE